MSENKWYVATLIMVCKVENEPGPWTCDEQICVIRATSEQLAYEKALQLGEDSATSYQNVYGQTVQWSFVGLGNLEEILADAIRDGTEIRSRLFGHNEPSKLVLAKEQLSVFGAQNNPHSIHYKQEHKVPKEKGS